jgi:hypothetical protein
MFRPYVRMHQPLGFFFRELESLFRFLAEGDLDGRRELLPRRISAFKLGLEQVHRDVRAREQLARGLLTFFQKTEKNVLGPDDLAPLLAGLVWPSR